MSRADLVTAARRTLAHTRAGAAPLADGHLEVPVEHYLDEARWRLEVDRIFRRVPLLLAFSCEVAEKHAYKAMQFMDVPILLSRDGDGQLHSFVNMCRHRGAQVREVGGGIARRHTCPYHSWAYDSAGALAGVFDRAYFGEVDADCHGLVALPVEERDGLVFGGLVPGETLELDRFLGAYADLLAMHDFGHTTLIGREVVPGPNWKVAYDGYLDFYHLPILHKRTFGPDYPNKVCADAYGPHQRLVQPDGRIQELDGVAEDDWSMADLLGGVFTIFPNVSIASFRTDVGRMYQIAQLAPGPGPLESSTILNWLAVGSPDAAAVAEMEKQIDFLVRVVRDEDYATGLTLQRALATGAMPNVLFGRNEGTNQRFHRWTDALVAAETVADTAALLDGAPEWHDPAP